MFASRQAPDLSQLPAYPPPPGFQVDFNDPDNYKRDNIILHCVVLAFMTITVCIRLYTRAVIKRNFGIDDWLALLSWALAVEFSIILAYATKWGFGMHIYEIRASEIINTMKWLTVSQISYFPVILSIKLCILVGYMRIFQIDNMTRWAMWFGIFSCSVFYIIMFFIDIFRCKPVEAAWNPTVKGKCVSYAAFPWATGIFNFVSDFYILILPMPVILRMLMPLGRRLRIAAIFGLGLFTCISSVMRFVVSRQYASDIDQTYVAAKVLHWTVLEINIGLMCACAACFPAFFDASAPRSLASFLNSLLAKGTTSQVALTTSSGTDKGSTESHRNEVVKSKGGSRLFLSRPSKASLKKVEGA